MHWFPPSLRTSLPRVRSPSLPARIRAHVVLSADLLLNHTIAPLALPNLADRSPLTSLARLEALSKVLGLILRTPTSERTGPVDIPVGALVELGVRLVGMNSEMPVSLFACRWKWIIGR